MNTATQQQDYTVRGKKGKQWIKREDRWSEFNSEMTIIKGQQLRDNRERLGVTRTEMAKLMEVSVSRLRRLENGEPVRDYYLLKKFYEFMIGNIEREIEFFNKFSSFL